MADDDKPMYAEDLAKTFGIDVTNARRRLREWERKHGSTVVGLDISGGKKGRRYVTKASLAVLRPATRQRGSGWEPRVELLERELDAVRGQLRELRTLYDELRAATGGNGRSGPATK